MAFNPVQAAEALTRGARSEFLNTYRKSYAGVLASLAPVMDLAVASDKSSEIYVYPESAPYPRRRPQGQSIQSKNFRYRSYTITNVDWSSSVEWDRGQVVYDQTGSIISQARQAGANFATLPERVFFQLMTSTTDSALLASASPNAPDGAGLYSSTDGASANRFGVSGGNLVTGTGVTLASTIRADVFNAIERFLGFQDTEGQPFLDPGMLDSGFKMFFNYTNLQVVNEALVQKNTQIITQNVAASENVATTAVSNIVLDSGFRIQLVPTQRITDNDMFLFANAAWVKPIVEQVATPLEEMPFNVGNSDQARDYQIEGIRYIARRGYGLNLPFGTVKINN